MKKRFSPILVFLFILLVPLLLPGPPVFASESWDQLVEELDTMHYFDRNQEIIDRVDRYQPENEYQRGHVLWRRARARLSLADLAHWEGSLTDDEALALIDEADRDAVQALERVPDDATAHMWRAAVIGRRGLLRGVLRSLIDASVVDEHGSRAVELDPTLPEAYYVLGQLYRELPGWPLSFGNNDYAVSLGRASVAYYEEKIAASDVPVRYYDHYTQLAHSLWVRNNSVRQRERRVSRAAADFRAAGTNMERAFNFEGTVRVPNQTDREEALALVRRVVRELSAVSSPRVRQRMDLAKARELLESWE